MTRADPRSNPEWRAIRLECELVKQVLGNGLTSIGKANYADGMGQYYNAFFSLSIGIERLLKLTVCFDFEQSKSRFPSAKELRSFGHNLSSLRIAVDEISKDRSARSSYGHPKDEICELIIKQLEKFADARIGRYANYSVLEDIRAREFEPISSWIGTVGNKILDRHFRGKKIEEKARISAALMDTLLGDMMIVMHMSEDGTPLDRVETASFRTAETEVLQKYGRYYSFLIIRQYVGIFKKLTAGRGYEEGGELWSGHYELFNCYHVDEEFGRTRKVWPLH